MLLSLTLNAELLEVDVRVRSLLYGYRTQARMARVGVGSCRGRWSHEMLRHSLPTREFHTIKPKHELRIDRESNNVLVRIGVGKH